MERAAARTKQPWIVLKLAVGITLGLIGYASYVYVGRLCVPMIREDDSALGGRTLGIVIVAVFSLLLLMTLWTYEKVVLTSPGLAKDCIREPDPPVLLPGASWAPASTVGPPYQELHPIGDPSAQRPIQEPPPTHRRHSNRTRTPHASSEKPARPALRRRSYPSQGDYDVNAGVSGGAAAVTSSAPQKSMSHAGKEPMRPPQHSRQPPMTPVLLPESRYCFREELLKPVRAHHCRACDSCVLKYDHHCPWIGQCVGARNHKFFVHFLQWASLFCLWVFSAMLALNVKASSKPGFDIDVQQIVIIAIAGLFSLFTSILLVNHIRMIMMNQTTVEYMGFMSMIEREKASLEHLHPWYDFGARRRTRRKWDAEWGRIGREGNLWWLGSKKANWEAVMGVSAWWWILPIGRSAGDGTVYPTNPRFDETGRWRRRSEWPMGLR